MLIKEVSHVFDSKHGRHYLLNGYVARISKSMLYLIDLTSKSTLERPWDIKIFFTEGGTLYCSRDTQMDGFNSGMALCTITSVNTEMYIEKKMDIPPYESLSSYSYDGTSFQPIRKFEPSFLPVPLYQAVAYKNCIFWLELLKEDNCSLRACKFDFANDEKIEGEALRLDLQNKDECSAQWTVLNGRLFAVFQKLLLVEVDITTLAISMEYIKNGESFDVIGADNDSSILLLNQRKKIFRCLIRPSSSNTPTAELGDSSTSEPTEPSNYIPGNTQEPSDDRHYGTGVEQEPDCDDFIPIDSDALTELRRQNIALEARNRQLQSEIEKKDEEISRLKEQLKEYEKQIEAVQNIMMEMAEASQTD